MHFKRLYPSKLFTTFIWHSMRSYHSGLSFDAPLKTVPISMHVRIQIEGQGARTPLENYKNIGFLSNTGPPDPLKFTKLQCTKPACTKPAFNVEPSSALQQNAIYMAFRWRAVYGIWILPPLIKLKK